MNLLFEIIIRSILPPFYSFSLVETLCKKRLERCPNHHDAIWILSNLYVLYRTKYDEAKNLLESLVVSRKATKADKLLLSKIYYRLGRHIDVVNILGEPHLLSDKDIENCYLGSSLVEVCRFEDATRYLKIYISYHHPKDFLVFTRLGHAFYMLGLYDQALDAYQNAGKLNPREKGIIDNINLCIEKQKSQLE